MKELIENRYDGLVDWKSEWKKSNPDGHPQHDTNTRYRGISATSSGSDSCDKPITHWTRPL